MPFPGEEDEDQLDFDFDAPEPEDDEVLEGEGEELEGEPEATATDPNATVVAGKAEDATATQDAPKLSRGAARIAKLANERKEAVARAQQLEAQLAAQQQLQQQQAQQQAAAQQQAQMQQYYEQLEPPEQMRFMMQQQQAYFQQQLQQQQMQLADVNDRTAFNELCGRDPRAKRYSVEVENQLKQMRASGANAPREQIYYWVLGQKMAQAAKANGGATAKKQAANNVKRQAVPARTGKGDLQRAGRDGGNSLAALESRLRDVPI